MRGSPSDLELDLTHAEGQKTAPFFGVLPELASRLLALHRMRSIKTIFVLLLSMAAPFASGCLSVSNAHVATPVDGAGALATNGVTPSGLFITSEEIAGMASRYFGAIEVTFQNRTAHWVNVDGVQIDFWAPNHNAGVLIPWGEQLKEWQEATDTRNYVDGVNGKLLLSALGAAGGIITRSRHGAVAAGGGLLTVAALAGQVNADVREQSLAASSIRFPDGHLLAGAFSVPPGLFVKRWIVVNTDNTVPCLRWLSMSYVADGTRGERAVVQFRSAVNADWQPQACAKREGAPS